MFYRLFVYFEDKIILCVSEALMTEYYHVLRRLKFAVYYDFASRAEALLADFEAKSAMCIPVISLNLISDNDDNKILELADVCEANYIITGNTNDFTFPT